MLMKQLKRLTGRALLITGTSLSAVLYISTLFVCHMSNPCILVVRFE